MNVFIRADASAASGSGHLMRCLALADELRRRGAAVSFITRAATTPWGDLIGAHGHRVVALAPDFPGWAADAQATQQVLADSGACAWLIVDHYELGRDWEEALRAHADRIFAIDDVGRSHACDVLLDQNVLGGDPYAQAVPAACRRLFGPRYALLRGEFAAARAQAPQRGDACRQILINFGGSDPTRETKKAIAAFLQADLGAARAQVVLGAANPLGPELRRQYAGEARIEIIDQSERMAALMAAADLAIGAGGISTWERASLGLPSIVIAVAANQEAIAADLAQRGSHCYLGRSAEVDVERLAASLSFLAHNGWLRSAFGRASAARCDGHGARRVASTLLGAATLTLRPATAADSAAILAWRNAAAVREFSADPAPIVSTDHERWFAQILGSADRHLLIGSDTEGPVGVLRFDVADAHAEVSIYLVPERIGSGAGAGLLAAGHDWLARQRPALREVRARVLAQNPRSIALFEHAGYRCFDYGYRLSLHAAGDSV